MSNWFPVFTGGYYRYDDELVVPIVENTPEEKDLKVIISMEIQFDHSIL